MPSAPLAPAAKTARLRQAQDEAAAEVAAYRAQREEQYRRMIAAVCAASRRACSALSFRGSANRLIHRFSSPPTAKRGCWDDRSEAARPVRAAHPAHAPTSGNEQRGCACPLRLSSRAPRTEQTSAACPCEGFVVRYTTEVTQRSQLAECTISFFVPHISHGKTC